VIKLAIRVIKNRIFDGTKTYEIGETIKGLSEKEESQLVSDGIAEYTFIRQEEKQEKQEVKSDINNNDINVENALLDDNKVEEDNIINEEKEEEKNETIDPNSLVLNPEEYVKESASKNKK
jgi:hypothetical protein